ncbi:MAG: DegT/DnrJ/EryC1/StrS family aminotransferase [Spirochaetales bacterium]|nr:DegT/DnrJ/EryC1/StrS family aminotransferase [Spirochaetales bacterium]
MSERLAIDGGKPVVDPSTIKPWPVIDERDRTAVLRALEGDYLCGGEAPEARALEQEWARYVGRRYCLTTSSGTAALHMALAALNIGPGDEVIVPSYTFLASASCVLHAGAIPVFVDIDRRTYTMDPAQIEARISEHTKAVIPVHLHGLCADMDPIREVARKHELHVIEDACQAHGAEYKGRKAGNLGDLAAFSLNSSKNLCAGEGGLLVMDDQTCFARAGMLRMFGDEIDDETRLRVYNASILGYMYRNQELPAALTRSQLGRLDENNAIRIRNCDYLTENLQGIPGLHTPYVPKGYKHVYWMYIVEFHPEETDTGLSPEEFRIGAEKALFAEGVQLGQWQTMPVPAQDLFQTKAGYSNSGFPWSATERGRSMVYRAQDYPNAVELCRRYTAVVGHTPPNGLELMEKYVAAFRKVFSNLDVVEKHRRDTLPAHYSGKLFRAK